MKNYRIAFIIVLVANLILAAVLAGFWWRSQHRAAQKSAVTPASNPAPQQEMNNPPAPPSVGGDAALSHPTFTRTPAIDWCEVRSSPTEGPEGHHSHNGDGRD